MVLSQHLKAGVNLELPIQLAHSNSVAVRYLKEGVPVINIRRMSELRTQYDLRLWKVGMGVGTGSFFFHERYNIWYAGISLLIIILACWVEIQMQFKKKHTNHVDKILFYILITPFLDKLVPYKINNTCEQRKHNNGIKLPYYFLYQALTALLAKLFNKACCTVI